MRIGSGVQSVSELFGKRQNNSKTSVNGNEAFPQTSMKVYLKPSYALEADCCFGGNNNSCSVRLYSKRQGQHICKRNGIVCVFSSGGNL